MNDSHGHPILNHSRCGTRMLFDRPGEETLGRPFTRGLEFDYYCPNCRETVEVVGNQEFIPVHLPPGYSPQDYLVEEMVEAVRQLVPETFKRSNYPLNRKRKGPHFG